MKRPQKITSQLKTSDSELRNYVLALEKENVNLQKYVAKLEVLNVSQQNKIKVLQKMQPRTELKIIRPYKKNNRQSDDKKLS